MFSFKSFVPRKSSTYVIVGFGALVGVLLMIAIRTMWLSPSVAHKPPAQFRVLKDFNCPTFNTVLAQHLSWAEDEGTHGLSEGLDPVRSFFTEAKGGTRTFAEDVLGFDSKWALVSDYFTKDESHKKFIEAKFAERIFSANELEKLIESIVSTYLQHLDDVDSQLLVRLEKDLAELPIDTFQVSVDRHAIQQLLTKAIDDAVRSVHADFQGMVKREIVSFVTGEVLSMATTQLATSAGIVSFGAYSGVVTFGSGVIVGLIADQLVSWAYDALYDPVGEISNRLNQTLIDLENLILSGNDTSPGLEYRLRDYATRRNQARSASIMTVVQP